MFRHRLLGFVLFYTVLSVSALWLAPLGGRVAISCLSEGPLQVQSSFYCLTNRTYVNRELAEVITDAATQVDARFPGTVTLMLDGNFPFLDGFPLLPHLSHDDGRKVDLALYYRDGQDTYLPGKTKSPVGYFAFETGKSHCPRAWPTLRWDMAPLQQLWPEWSLDPGRTRYLMSLLAQEARLGKIFVEPHLAHRLDLSAPKIRFQGCRAARHDDHIHIQLRAPGT